MAAVLGVGIASLPLVKVCCSHNARELSLWSKSVLGGDRPANHNIWTGRSTPGLWA